VGFAFLITTLVGELFFVVAVEGGVVVVVVVVVVCLVELESILSSFLSFPSLSFPFLSFPPLPHECVNAFAV
jgi:hypothetical protein